MKYHLFNFEGEECHWPCNHDLWTIHFKQDCDFIYHYNQSISDAQNFISKNVDRDDLGIVFYCQSVTRKADAAMLNWLYEVFDKDKDKEIALKIVFFSFDWWGRGFHEFCTFCRRLFRAEKHYVVTFAPDIDVLEFVSGASYRKYESRIIFQNIWSCCIGTIKDFNWMPAVNKIGICGSVNPDYPDRRIVLNNCEKNPNYFQHVPFFHNDLKRQPGDDNPFIKRLSQFLCLFTAPPFARLPIDIYQKTLDPEVQGVNLEIRVSENEDEYQIFKDDKIGLNTHLIVLKVFEILASGALLLCPKSEEKYLNRMGLYHGVNCMVTPMDQIDETATFICNPENRNYIDQIRLAGHNFAKANFQSKHVWLKMKQTFNRLFGYSKGQDSQMFRDNQIEEGVVLGRNIAIGKGNVIKKGTVIHDGVIIGNNNVFLEDNRIGTLPVDAGVEVGDLVGAEAGAGCGLFIGDGNLFHFGNVISLGNRARDGGMTLIGDSNKFLSQVYISHDNRVHNHVVFYPRVFSSGYVEFFDYSNVGAGACIQQRSKVGAYAMIGMNGVLTGSAGWGRGALPFFININNKNGRINWKRIREGQEKKDLELKKPKDLELNLNLDLDSDSDSDSDSEFRFGSNLGTKYWFFAVENKKGFHRMPLNWKKRFVEFWKWETEGTIGGD